MTFRIHALPAEAFAGLFSLSDTDLARHNARRQIVQSHPGTPCRVSLADAEVGETVILVNYEHLPTGSPYRSSHAIFVREGAAEARPDIGEVPEVLRSRLISVRFFDGNDMMIDADVVPGDRLAEAITEGFRTPDIAYAHLHNAKPGCYAAKVTRA